MAAARRGKRLVRRRRPPQWHLLLSGAVLLIAVAAGVYLTDRVDPTTRILSSNPAPLQHDLPGTAKQFAERLHADSDSLLGELGIAGHLIEADRTSIPARIRVGVPRDLPLASVNVHLTSAIERLGGRVIEGRQTRDGLVDLRCGFDSTETTHYTLRRLRATARRTGDIGLIVRDVLVPERSSEGVWEIVQQLTLMIDSTSAQATSTQSWSTMRQFARVADHQVMGGNDPSANDARALRAMLDARQNGSPSSIVQLDDVQRPDAIARQLWALADQAADDGQAIGILRDHPSTHAALRSVLPRLERRGYRFVNAATLLQ